MEFRQKIRLSDEQLQTRIRPRVHIVLHSQNAGEIKDAIEEIADLIHGRIGSVNNYTDDTRLGACLVLLKPGFNGVLPLISTEAISGAGYPLIHLAADEPTGEIAFIIYKTYPELGHRGDDGMTPTLIQVLLERSPRVALDIIDKDPDLLCTKFPFFDVLNRFTVYDATVADMIVNQIGATPYNSEWIEPIVRVLTERKHAVTREGFSNMIQQIGYVKELTVDGAFGSLYDPRTVQELDSLYAMARTTALQMLGRS